MFARFARAFEPLWAQLPAEQALLSVTRPRTLGLRAVWVRLEARPKHAVRLVCTSCSTSSEISRTLIGCCCCHLQLLHRQACYGVSHNLCDDFATFNTQTARGAGQLPIAHAVATWSRLLCTSCVHNPTSPCTKATSPGQRCLTTSKALNKALKL